MGADKMVQHSGHRGRDDPGSENEGDMSLLRGVLGAANALGETGHGAVCLYQKANATSVW